MSSTTLAAYTAEDQLASFPVLTEIPRPAALFDRLPLELMLRWIPEGDKFRRYMLLEGHQSSVELIHDYAKLHCVGSEFIQLTDTVYLGAKQLVIEGTHVQPILLPAGPLLFISFIEKVLEFERVESGVTEGGTWMWMWRRKKGFM